MPNDEASRPRRSPPRTPRTAAEVFAEQGYNATTVRKIADARRHARGQPLLPLRLQGIDAGRDPADLPRRAVGQYDTVLAADLDPRDLEGRHRVVPGDRPAPRRRRDLPEGGQPPADARALRLPRRPQRRVREGVAARWNAGSTPRSSAPTSTSGSPTGSSATPCGSPRPGTGPAEQDRPQYRDHRGSPRTVSLNHLLEGSRHGRGLHRRSGPHARRAARGRARERPPRRPRRARR